MPRSAILDTNLLLLAIVAPLAPHLVGRGRLQVFRQQDASLLSNELGKFVKFFTVPHVLAETSNFIGHDEQEICPGANEAFALYVETVEEIPVPAERIVRFPEFLRLGLTDTVLFEMGRRGITTITVDFPLANRLQKLKLPCINFNHLRTPRDP